MPTCFDLYWDDIIQECKKRITKNAAAGIRSVIDSMIESGAIPRGTNLMYYEEEIQTLAGKITESNEYIHVQDKYDTYIFKNPNYALFDSQIQTNESFRNLNNVVLPENFESQDKIAKRSFWLAALSTAFIIITVGQQFPNTTDQELRGIKLQLQKAEQKLEALQLSLKEINSSLQTGSADTTKKK